MNLLSILLSSLVFHSSAVKAESPKLYLDATSGLEWRALGGPMLSWKDAKQGCLSLGSEWRLPSRQDFAVSAMIVSSIPEVKNQPKLSFWSSTTYKGGRVSAFYQGKLELRDTFVEGTAVFPVICVRDSAPVELKIKKGDLIEISVSNLNMNVEISGRRQSTECLNKPAINLDFETTMKLTLSCGQAYGGVVRLHNVDDRDPRAGTVVGNDWGNEGCFEITSSKLQWTKDGTLSLNTETRYGGKHVDGTESDCNPRVTKETFTFNRTKKAFEKSLAAKK